MCGSGLAPACNDGDVFEYGSGVGEVSGQAGGGSGGASMDVGASLGQLVTDASNTISTTPPGILLLGLVLVVVGFMMLKRVF
jgi:hypothetical protein